jgi:hypothetical protein
MSQPDGWLIFSFPVSPAFVKMLKEQAQGRFFSLFSHGCFC